MNAGSDGNAITEEGLFLEPGHGQLERRLWILTLRFSVEHLHLDAGIIPTVPTTKPIELRAPEQRRASTSPRPMCAAHRRVPQHVDLSLEPSGM
ncbi:hypothetical protein [Gemmatimonas sp.]|uniref:hypothetical protein n=1 Tax=Gemmatimonas sp. TaxID=1962908 RepID=UPI00356232BE